MPDRIDDRIARLVRRATVSDAQRAANVAAAETLRRAARREREELADKWHADQAILTELAEKATRSAAAPFAAFAFQPEASLEADTLGVGRFAVECTDGSQAILDLEARASGRVVLAYGDTDGDGLARELPLLTADEDAYAAVIAAFLAVVRAEKRDD